jgi:pentatricopeptide repeat protein
MQQQGVQPSVVLYNSAISACIQGGDYAVAVQLLEQMRASTDAAPDKFSYASAIAACLEPAAWRTALQLLEDMRSEGIVPGVQAYGGAVTCLCKAGMQTCLNMHRLLLCCYYCSVLTAVMMQVSCAAVCFACCTSHMSVVYTVLCSQVLYIYIFI